MQRVPWFLAVMVMFVSGACGSTPPPSPPFKPVADVNELMNDIIDPAADAVWEASGWTVTKDGVVERGPKNNEEWRAVRGRAMAVAEAGNLLMMAPRAKDDAQWMTLARALIEKGEECVKAADARSPQRIFDTGGELYQTCLNCHMEYLPEMRDPMKK